MIIGVIVNILPSFLKQLILLLCMASVFSLAGVQLFMGKFRNHCFVMQTGVLFEPKTLCSSDTSSFSGRLCPPTAFCADAGFNDMPINFDSIGVSMVTVLLFSTGEGWSETMHQAWDTVNIVTSGYFFVMVFLLNMFIIQLMV